MKPAREHATNNAQTYFVTSDTWERRALFITESWARLFFKTLLSHRGEAYLVHEFVLMPDHFHLLITPVIALEKAIQLIKGGFSYRAKKELGSNMEVWRRGFADHRIRDAEDYDKHLHYIHLNPVKKHLCASPAEYRYSSAYPGWKLDPIPQGLKPLEIVGSACGTAEAVPFQDTGVCEIKRATKKNARRHDTQPMTRLLSVVALLVGLGSLISSAQVKSFRTPLDLHIESLRAHQIDPLTVRFAAVCGVDLKGVSARYGFSNDRFETWHAVSDLPKAYDSRVMHLIGTAEVWRLDNRMVIEEWEAMLDVASVSRALYCFDADKKLRMLDAAEFRIPVDGTLRWGMHRRWTRKPDGAFIPSEPFHFIGLDGEPAPVPKLTKDDRQIAAHWSKRLPAPTTADGLKLPASLMGESQVLSQPN